MLNAIDESLLSQKRLVEVRQFPEAAIADMYDYLKPNFKRPNLHIGTNGFSKSAPKEIFDNVLALKGIVASQNEKCKTIISTFTMCSDSSKNGCSPESN